MVKVRDANLAKRPRIVSDYGFPSQIPYPFPNPNLNEGESSSSSSSRYSPAQATTSKQQTQSQSQHHQHQQPHKDTRKKRGSEKRHLLSLQTCTKVIAAIQILFSIFMLSLVSVLGDEVIHAYIAEEWKVNTLETASVIGILLGLFLFGGAHFGWPSMLLIWMFGTGMGLTLLLFIRGVIVSGLLIKGGINWIYLLHFIPPICICAILAASLHAVSLYRNQLITTQQQLRKYKRQLQVQAQQQQQTIFTTTTTTTTTDTKTAAAAAAEEPIPTPIPMPMPMPMPQPIHPQTTPSTTHPVFRGRAQNISRLNG